MLEIIECQKARSAVTSIKVLQNNLVAISTQSHGIRIFSLDDCKNKNILSIMLLGHKTTAIDFHSQQNICAFANEQVIYIVSLLNKEILQTIYTHNGSIDVLSFVEKTPYLIAGTTEGRVMLYRYDGSSEISRLHSFLHAKTKHNAVKNYVSAIESYNHLVASSGYGSCVTLIHLNSYSNKKDFCDSKARVNSICFIDENLLLYGNINATVFIQPLNSRKKAKTITMPFLNIKNILHFKNSDFVVISGDSNSLVLINIRTAKIICSKYISFEDKIDKIVLTQEQNIIVVLCNNQILHVKLPKAQDLQNALQNKKLSQAFEMVHDNPKLQETHIYKKFEQLHENLYIKAMQALIKSNKKELEPIIKLLSILDTKSQEIDLMYQAYEQYPKFKNFYIDKKYAFAYTLSEKFPALKHTPQYTKMEEAFKENFTFAQKQILIGRKDIAADVLTPYITVFSKRAIIDLLLKQNKEFLQFLKALQTKDYSTINMLAAKYEVFQEIPSYIGLKESQKKELQKIDLLIDNGQIDNAITGITALHHSTCTQEALKDVYIKAHLAKELLYEYEQNNFKACYELIDANEILQKLHITILLEKHWQKLMEECESFALKGDIRSLKETLQKLILIKTRTSRVGDLLRLSFQIKIKQLIAHKKFKNAENIIYSYIDIFGMDKELNIIMNSYKKYVPNALAITQTKEKRIERDSWLNSQVFMNS